MRFIENGPNIPDELLFAQDEGQVVFFCGAGVSMAKAGLPSFYQLAENVLTELGTPKNDKARKLFNALKDLDSSVYTQGQISADLIFNSLRRSYDSNTIGRAVALSLISPSGADLRAHKIILKLARLQSGETRLITTNFDLLFEKCQRNIASITRASLPRIEYSGNDWGIVHLHGKVSPDYSGPDEDGFVLSSSEFGDAYLAQGWARDFVKSVLNKFNAVFIGYRADDPPVRYLLEGLQQGEGPKHKLYAFQSGPNDEAVAQWNEKGVEAITYDESQEHVALWETLEAWATRSASPIAWRNRVLSKGRKSPVRLEPHERGMVAHTVKSVSGAKAFLNQDPPMSAEWLCVFDPKIRNKKVEKDYYCNYEEKLIHPYQLYGLDDDPPPSSDNVVFEQKPIDRWDAFQADVKDYEELNHSNLPAIRGYNSSHIPALSTRLSYLADWVVKVADQRLTPWWVGQQLGIHPRILDRIRFNMNHKNDPPIKGVLRDVWNKIFEVSLYDSRDDHSDHLFKNKVTSSGWTATMLREYGRESAPFLRKEPIYGGGIPRDNRRKLDRRSLLNVDVKYPEGIYAIEIPDEKLQSAVSTLRANIEVAIDMERDYSGWIDFCAIEEDVDPTGRQFSRSYGLSGYVLNFVNYYRKLVDYDLQQANDEYNSWRKEDEIFARLRVWASGFMNVTSAHEFAEEVCGLRKSDFWSFKGDRDLMLSLRKRWDELSDVDKRRIESKILQGPSGYRGRSSEENEAISAHHQLNRLHWLDRQGCELSLDLKAVTQKLRKKAPDWKPIYAEAAADSHDGAGGWVKTDTDWSSLASVSPRQLIEKSKKFKGRDIRSFTEFAPFQGICDEAPLRALAALKFELKEGGFSEEYWESFLSRDARKKDSFRLKLLIAGRLKEIPNDKFKDILLTASRWFEDAGPELRKKNIRMYQAVWSKFIQTIERYENESKSSLVRQESSEIDWATEAINSPSGNLAELVMTDPEKDGLKAEQGFPEQWVSYVDELLGLPDDAHRYAMVIFAFNLSWLFNIDPKWTESRMLAQMEEHSSDKDDKEAIWAGFMWGAKLPNEPLYKRLKSQFLSMAVQSATDKRRDIEVLSGLVLSGWGSEDNATGGKFVTDEEMRSVLLNSSNEFRNYILWHLKNWSNSKDHGWDKMLLPFLQNVWPKQKKIRTKNTTSTLCEIALGQVGSFPELSKAVTQLVSKVDSEHIFIPEVKHASEIASKYPSELLELLYAVLSDKPENWPYGTSDLVKEIEISDSNLQKDPRLIALKSRLNEL